MPIPEFPPKRDSDLLAWSANFSAKITATPTAFGLVAAQSTAYAALHDAWSAAYETAIEPSTNSKANIIAKNVAKDNLLNGDRGSNGARELVAIVQAFPGTTDFMRGELGLKIRDVNPSPVPQPTVAPDISIVSVLNRSVKVRLRDAENADRRGKPDGVQGATILTHVGETAPQDPMQWTFAINTSKTLFDVDFPATVAAGARVWLTALWFNARKDTSPPSTAVSVRLADAMSMPMAA